MELRDKRKGGFEDEIIFSSRISADLLDDDAGPNEAEGDIVSADEEE